MEVPAFLDRLCGCEQIPKFGVQFHTTPPPFDKNWQILSMELLLESVDSSTLRCFADFCCFTHWFYGINILDIL